MAIYTTAAVVRACHDSLSAVNFTTLDDTAIAAFVESHVHPEIEATLEAAGYTVPSTDTLGVLKMVEGYLGAAAILRRYAQAMYGGNGGVAEMLETLGRSKLVKVVSGEMDIGVSPSTLGGIIAVEQSPQDRGANETYVTREPGSWAYPAETRDGETV